MANGLVDPAKVLIVQEKIKAVLIQGPNVKLLSGPLKKTLQEVAESIVLALTLEDIDKKRKKIKGTINKFKLKLNDPKAFDCHDGKTRYLG